MAVMHCESAFNALGALTTNFLLSLKVSRKVVSVCPLTADAACNGAQRQTAGLSEPLFG